MVFYILDVFTVNIGICLNLILLKLYRMTNEKKEKLQKEYNKSLEALKNSIDNNISIKKNKKQKFDFIKFSNTLDKLPEPVTTIEDIKYRGFHYEQ